MDKVIMTNLNGEVLIVSKEEAEKIQAQQIADMINNSFTSTMGVGIDEKETR